MKNLKIVSQNVSKFYSFRFPTEILTVIYRYRLYQLIELYLILFQSSSL